MFQISQRAIQKAANITITIKGRTDILTHCSIRNFQPFKVHESARHLLVHPLSELCDALGHMVHCERSCSTLGIAHVCLYMPWAH